MAELQISGKMSVARLQTQFKESYGGTLRVFHGAKFADPKATLASIRKNDVTGGDFSASGNMHAGRFEEEMMEKFGIKVQVANKDNTALVPNNTSLSSSGK